MSHVANMSVSLEIQENGTTVVSPPDGQVSIEVDMYQDNNLYIPAGASLIFDTAGLGLGSGWAAITGLFLAISSGQVTITHLAAGAEPMVVNGPGIVAALPTEDVYLKIESSGGTPLIGELVVTGRLN